MTLEMQHTTRPLRIAVLAHLHHPISPPFAGGMESHTAHVVEEFINRGHDVTLYAKEGSQPACRLVPVLPASFVVRGYPDEDHRNRQHQVLDDAMHRAVSLIRGGSFDVVLNNSLSPIPHRELSGIPTLHILHTPALPRLLEIFKAAEWVQDPTHRLVTVSHANARQWGPWLPELHVIYNGISLERWSSSTAPLEGTAAWTGRITPEKGLHVAIAAARETSVKLQVAGPIQDLEYFRTLIEPQLDANILYRGHLDQQEMRSMIAAAQVFISSPLWEEPFGLTTVEAMACGTPVAALPAGAMGELIGLTGGVVAASDDSRALAAAIDGARTMDRVAVAKRAQAFSLASMIDSYEGLLQSLAPVPPHLRSGD